VGDGANVGLWHDLWGGDKALKEAFSDFYGIAYAKDASVAAHSELSSGFDQWNVSFGRATNDWQVVVFVLFFNLLYSVRVRREGEDKLWWTHSKKSLFVVSSFYSVLVYSDDIPFHGKIIWQTKVPLSETFFALVGGPREDLYHGKL
jgi:hypothetical protein